MKIALFIFIFMYVFVATADVVAAEEMKIMVDGRMLEFDVMPQNVNGRILVPLRAIFEEMGAVINWDDGTKTVTAAKGNTEIVLVIGNSNPTINGEIVEIDQPGIIVDGRALAPLRFVSEAFGGSVAWDASKSTAYITFISEETDAIRFNREYPQVGENNIFTYRSVEEIIDTLEKGTGAIFFGFQSCPWCQVYAPVLNEVAMGIGIEEIFYFDIREIRENHSEEYQKIVSFLKEYLDLDMMGKPRVFVPDFTVVKNGVIIGHDNETSTISGEITPVEYWTEERKDALIQKLESMLIQLYSAS